MSWTAGSSSTGGGGGGGTTKKLNAFLMSEDRWQRSLKEHNQRVRHVKPAVDLKSPWGCSRPYVPLPPQGQHDSARGRPGSAATSSRPNSARPTSAASRNGNRPSSAISNNNNQPSSRQYSSRSVNSNNNMNQNSVSSSSSGPQIIAHLPLQQQRLCEEMVKLLAGLRKEQSKVVLEHLYSSAEESRLLQSYSGVYPGLLVSHADGDDNDDNSFQDEQGAAVSGENGDDDGYIRNDDNEDGDDADQEKFQSHNKKPPRR